MSLNELEGIAIKEIPDFNGGFISFPHPKKGGPMTVRGNFGGTYSLRSRYCSRVEFKLLGNGKYEITKVRDIRKLGFGEQFLDTFKPLHFGTFAGLFGRLLWVFVGLTPGILFISGTIISMHRKKGKKKKKIKKVEALISEKPIKSKIMEEDQRKVG